jgi:hypothetical protein
MNDRLSFNQDELASQTIHEDNYMKSGTFTLNPTVNVGTKIKKRTTLDGVKVVDPNKTQ